MFRNYLRITTRVLLRNKLYTVVNALGLAMGIAAFLLILEYVGLEKSVNQFHARLPDMYRVLCEGADGVSWPQVEPGWAPRAKEQFPEVQDFCRFEDGIARGIVTNRQRNVSFREEQIGYAEGNFFRFFSFPLRAGDPAAFAKPYAVFIAENAARRYFGTDNPLGKTLYLDNQFGNREYVVEGVFADMGENSDIRYDLVFSLETLKNPANLNDNGWANLDNLDNQYIYTFFLLAPGTDAAVFEKKLTAMRREIQPEKDAVNFRVQAFREVHLADSFSDTLLHTGNVRYVYMLAGIALLILLIAWFNYVNLSTATSWRRANEVGVRKSVGATRSALVAQLLGESVLLNVLAFALAIVLVLALQPHFNNIVGKDLSLAMLVRSHVWIYGLGAVLAGTLASGVYSAFSLSGYNPVDILRGRWLKGTQGVFLRKTLVVAQFGISTALVLFTILVYSQLQYMQNRDLGMRPEQLLVVEGPDAGQDSTFARRHKSFRDAVMGQSFVTAYCNSGCVPGHAFNFSTEGFTTPRSQPGDENKSYAFAIIDERYLETYGIALKAGRNFSAAECAVRWNDNSKVLLNERALAQLGFASPEDALRTRVRWDERELDVIGIVGDYHHSGLQQAIEPIIFYPQNNSAYFTLRLAGGDLQGQVEKIGQIYSDYFPGNPYDYFFADDDFNRQYISERRYGALFSMASVWAVFIACLGLFGLATYTVEARVKEIGIRKVLGASVAGIAVLLSKDFLKLVLIALVAASPLAYYFMEKWLADFAYRIDVQWWMFALAGAVAGAVAMLTVGFQSIKAALANPVQSLRNE